MQHGTRLKVLSSYRSLLRIGKEVFGEDKNTYEAMKLKIREEINLHKYEKNIDKINEQIACMNSVSEILPKAIVQAVLNERGNYELKLTDYHMEKNIPIKNT
ncbi:Uncharacterised protein g725 [Pycnogonum litorale]